MAELCVQVCVSVCVRRIEQRQKMRLGVAQAYPQRDRAWPPVRARRAGSTSRLAKDIVTVLSQSSVVSSLSAMARSYDEGGAEHVACETRGPSTAQQHHSPHNKSIQPTGFEPSFPSRVGMRAHGWGQARPQHEDGTDARTEGLLSIAVDRAVGAVCSAPRFGLCGGVCV